METGNQDISAMSFLTLTHNKNVLRCYLVSIVFAYKRTLPT